MFFCQILKKASLKNEKLNRITIVTRPKVYTKFIKDEETNQWVEIEVAKGFEIVKEVAACAEGVVAWNSLTDSERDRLAADLCRGK